MPAVPFFTRVGATFEPNDPCRGPWDRESLHGRVIAGMIAHEIETTYGDPAFQYSRLTVDMFRVAPYAPVHVTSALVRDGNRIKVADATIWSGETAIGRGSVLMLRRAEQPEGEVWSRPGWNAPSADSFPPEERRAEGWEPAWETRRVPMDPSSPTPKRVWIREARGFIDGVPLTPFVRCALVSDFTSPFAIGGTKGLNHVNADATLYLHRDLVGEWIGVEVVYQEGAEGIANGLCVLHDAGGAIGTSTVCAVANRRKGNW